MINIWYPLVPFGRVIRLYTFQISSKVYNSEWVPNYTKGYQYNLKMEEKQEKQENNGDI